MQRIHGCDDGGDAKPSCKPETRLPAIAMDVRTRVRFDGAFVDGVAGSAAS